MPAIMMVVVYASKLENYRLVTSSSSIPLFRRAKIVLVRHDSDGKYCVTCKVYTYVKHTPHIMVLPLCLANINWEKYSGFFIDFKSKIPVYTSDSDFPL